MRAALQALARVREALLSGQKLLPLVQHLAERLAPLFRSLARRLVKLAEGLWTHLALVVKSAHKPFLNAKCLRLLSVKV